MSMNLFADRKLAFGFAGLTVVIAVVAAIGLDSFTPSPGSEVSSASSAETTPSVAPSPAQPEPAWADEEFADDWNADSVRQANGFSGWASGTNSKDEIEPTFGDFSPENGGREEKSSPRPGKPRKIEGQGTVTSRAASYAPAVTPPGASAPGKLELAE